jgi:transposase
MPAGDTRQDVFDIVGDISSKSGVWQRIFAALAADVDNEYAMIDSTIVRAHQHSAGEKKRRPKPKRSCAVAAD